MFLTAVCMALGGYAVLIFFYFRHWQRLQLYVPAASSSPVFVSVIVAARNEEQTLPQLLHDLSRQRYPASQFEVIVVNDFSTDQTGRLATTFDGTNMQMIFPDASPETSSKKAALASGIQKAKGELILVTDADCRVGEEWVQTMASFYAEKGAAFIAAPVKFTHDRSLLQTLQALDFLTLQGITAASVAANAHTMCNGANLAYTRKAFEEVNGFEGIDNVPTGDDMLLMHKIWKKAPSRVFYLKSREAIVSTAPMETWREFLMQRRRWASKTLLYDDHRITAVLAFVLLLNLLPFALVIAGFIQPVYFLYLLLFLLAKTLIEWPFVASVAAFYGEQKLLRSFFFLQPLHVFYTVLVGIWSQLGKYEWKGRKAHRRGVVG
ncbi:MAG TPA: glycosyltransferase [Flavisolibacter sp.]|nr:glycosyltransferase [Flavisolibacter sp.]